MTATSVRPAVFGPAALRAFYQRHLKKAFSFSIAGHILLAVAFLVGLKLADRQHTQTVRLVSYADLGPPPALTDQAPAPQIQVTSAAPPPSVGIPEPVPDAEVSPEATIQTQVEMSAMTSLVPTEGSGEDFNVQVVPPAQQQQQEITVQEDTLPSFGAFVPVEEQPVPVEPPKPVYPPLAIKAGIEGTVYVTVLVDKTGKVRDARVLKGPEVLRQAALDAVRNTVWRPAIQNHRPVAVWVAYPFRFQLEH